MASGQGTAIIDFGVAPGANEASIAVTGQASILAATAKAEAFIVADDTSADHTASDHRYIGCWLNLSCGDEVDGVGFTIHGRSLEQLEGKYTVRWVWEG